MVLQPNAARLYAAFVFVGATLLHEFKFSDLDGIAYYGSAALLDLLVLILLSGISPIPRLAVRLQIISLISIIANMAGWLIWFLYLPPTVYDFTFYLLYAWALVELIRRNGDNVGGFTVDCWATCFRFDIMSRFLRLFKNGTEA